MLTKPLSGPAELRNSTANSRNLRKHRTRARTAARRFLPPSCESQLHCNGCRRKKVNHGSEALAARLETGPGELAAFASALSEPERRRSCGRDVRTRREMRCLAAPAGNTANPAP